MKLITLNTWGGKLYDPLLDFVRHAAEDTDVFCFQEMYQAPSDRIISRDMHSDIYGEIATNLKNHRGYFAPHLEGYDLNGKVDFPLKAGLAIFIKKDINVNECDDLPVYGSGLEILDDGGIRAIPRNLQYISFRAKGKNYLAAHFHGIWYPKTKVDSDDRINQSVKIKEFLSERSEEKILCGDFNLLPTTQSMLILEEGMINLIKKHEIKTTRNKYYEREEKYADYVLVSPEIISRQFIAMDALVSDHLPLLLEFE